jgi:carbonic anhydrase/acetyltransferase-like protein (isoleucine patch superfamily)
MSRAAWQIGQMFRETGIALERLGCRLQGNYTFLDQLSRHREVMALVSHTAPSVKAGCFVAPSASVVGKVDIGSSSSVLYGACVKADGSTVKIGTGSAIMDGAVVTADTGDVTIGNNVLVAAGSIIYSATLHDGAIVGSNAVVNKGAVVSGAVEAGAVVPEGTTVPADKCYASGGLRDLSSAEKSAAAAALAGLSDTVTLHSTACNATFKEIETEKQGYDWTEVKEDPDPMGLIREKPAPLW